MTDLKHKILIVDDTEATRYAISRTLKANGYLTVEAETGLRALELVKSEKPDLITLDIHLPDIIGFEVCRRIKSDPSTAHIPVLQISASYVTSKDVIHGLEGGADTYLTHPFEPPVLVATVKSLLRSRNVIEDLRLSEERFRVALKNAPIMIYTCDLDLKYTWIYNCPQPLQPQEFLGKTDAEIFDGTDAQKLTELKREVLAQRSERQALMKLNIAGELHCLDVTVEPFFGPDGELIGLTVACIDVTERVHAQLAQKEATEEAELANQAKSRFLSNMSHEIRTPLGIIQGFADLALDTSFSDDERHEYLLTIKRNARDLTKLLGEILDLSKIEAGRIEIDKTRFCLPDLISEVVLALGLQAKEKGVSLELTFSPGFPQLITSDLTRIRQIVINLVSNALKFTPQGSVAIVGSSSPYMGDGEPVVISLDIQDTGIGMNSDQQTRLFQAFTQADSSTTRKFGGSGLGLSLSKKLAQSLGGDVVLAKSEEGVGSKFRFTFGSGPLSESDFKMSPALSSRSETALDHTLGVHPLKGLKVLLVEDSADNQLLFTQYLQQAGAMVDFATDGNEGVVMALKQAYDVILMDVQMPNLDGFGATAVLRKKGLKTPIVALTAHAMKEDRTRALSEGFTNYLIKPVSSGALVKTVAEYRM